MRKHVYKELGFVGVSTRHTGEVDFNVVASMDNERNRKVSEEATEVLTAMGKKVLADLHSKLPEGMSVALHFTLLPEHDDEVAKCK